MTVQKYIGASFTSMGTGGVKKKSSAKAIVGVIFATPDTVVYNTVVDGVETATSIATVIDKQWWLDGIKSQNIFPFPKVLNYTDKSTPAKEYKSPAGNTDIVGDSIKGFQFDFTVPLDTHRAMQTFDGADLDVFLIEADGKIRYWNDKSGTTEAFRGFKTSLISPIMQTEVPADGGTPAMSGLWVEFFDYRQWDAFGDSFTPDWSAKSLEPLVPVTISVVQVGTTKVMTATVGSDGGYDPITGARISVPILGLTTDHFLVKDDGVEVVVVVTESTTTKGQYTITPTLTPITASVMTVVLQPLTDDLIGDLMIDPVGVASVTVTIA